MTHQFGTWYPIATAPKDEDVWLLGSVGGMIPFVMSWDEGDGVWVLTFAVHHANVDAVLAQRAEVAA